MSEHRAMMPACVAPRRLLRPSPIFPRRWPEGSSRGKGLLSPRTNIASLSPAQGRSTQAVEKLGKAQQSAAWRGGAASAGLCPERTRTVQALTADHVDCDVEPWWTRQECYIYFVTTRCFESQGEGENGSTTEQGPKI